MALFLDAARTRATPVLFLGAGASRRLSIPLSRMTVSRSPDVIDSTVETRVVVVRLSEAFEEIWTDMGRELGVAIKMLEEADVCAATPNVAAVVLAAGGCEREVLTWLGRNQISPDVPIIAVGADPSRRITAQIVARGAADYFALPEDVEILNNTLASVVVRCREAGRRRGNGAHPDAERAFADIVGESPAIKAVLDRASRVLPYSDATSLVMGETGTGKELLARGLHRGGPRRGGPFVPVNCSALPSQLIESELFGHERGAFTDAHSAKPGLFELADGGTLFLDEIGTLPLEVQGKLLRVLDDGEIRRVGGTKCRRVNVRIIAATNGDLQQAVATGKFREDLFYRLNVITHLLPPLRDRGNDVILIAKRLLHHLSNQYGLATPALNAEVKSKLMGYHWPGNVRELRNAVERALWLSTPGTLDSDELVPAPPSELSTGGSLPFPAPLDVITKAAARATLDWCGGNRSEAARQLAISRQRLARLLAEHESTITIQEEDHAKT